MIKINLIRQFWDNNGYIWIEIIHLISGKIFKRAFKLHSKIKKRSPTEPFSFYQNSILILIQNYTNKWTQYAHKWYMNASREYLEGSLMTVYQVITNQKLSKLFWNLRNCMMEWTLEMKSNWENCLMWLWELTSYSLNRDLYWKIKLYKCW